MSHGRRGLGRWPPLSPVVMGTQLPPPDAAPSWLATPPLSPPGSPASAGCTRLPQFDGPRSRATQGPEAGGSGVDRQLQQSSASAAFLVLLPLRRRGNASKAETPQTNLSRPRFLQCAQSCFLPAA